MTDVIGQCEDTAQSGAVENSSITVRGALDRRSENAEGSNVEIDVSRLNPTHENKYSISVVVFIEWECMRWMERGYNFSLYPRA